MLCSVMSVIHLSFMRLKNKNMLSLVLMLESGIAWSLTTMEVNFILSGFLVCNMWVVSFRGYFNAS